MCTIWEMAETIRAEERKAQADLERQQTLENESACKHNARPAAVTRLKSAVLTLLGTFASRRQDARIKS